MQSKVQCNSEDYKRAPTSFNDLKDNYIINEFVASSKKQEKQGNKKHQENSKCSIHEDVTKKEKKVEFNYKSLLLKNPSFFNIKKNFNYR